MMNQWIPCAERLPPQGEVVNTKIDDGNKCRNIQPLKLVGRLWFFPDHQMYVYYEPTHWKSADVEAPTK